MKVGIATCQEKPLLTVSDDYLVRELKRRHYEVVPFVWNMESQETVDAMIIRSVWDYHRSPQQFLEWIKEFQNKSIPVYNSSEVIQWNLDKSYLFYLEEHGVEIVPSILCSQKMQPEEVLENIRSTGWSEIVLKPTISATSFLTFKNSDGDPELFNQITQIQQQSDLLIQPFLPSILDQGEVSLIYFNDGGPRYSHSVIKRPQPGDYRVQSDFGGTAVLFDADESMIRFGKHCLSRLPYDWIYARVDAVDWQNKPLLGELEMIEPDLFMNLAPDSAALFADAFLNAGNRSF